MDQGTTCTGLGYQGLLDPFDRWRNQAAQGPGRTRAGPISHKHTTQTTHTQPGLGRSEGGSLGNGRETTSQGAKPNTPEMATEGIATMEL